MAKDTRLSGPAYMYDGVNRERGGLVTRQTLVKKDPYGISSLTTCYPTSEEPNAGERIADKDGCAFRERL